MGGRGASSGTSAKGNGYGSQYRTIAKRGNVKFVEKASKGSETLMETRTRGRVYAQVDRGEVKSLTFFDASGKRKKQVDLTHSHGGAMPHTHHGYLHNEADSPKGAARLTPKERAMVDRVLSEWAKYRGGQ